jgi:hypothetical protein
MGRKQGKRSGTASSSAPPPTATALDKEAMKSWFSQTTLALVAKALDQIEDDPPSSSGGHKAGKSGKPNTKAAVAEAQTRSAQLSTSSDKTGVSFAGGAFQANYFTSKFQRRGQLLYEILCDLSCTFSHGPVHVASFGGGPGTDVAGLVWLQKQRYPESQFKCTMYDYEKSFKKFVKTLQDAFSEVGQVEIEFQPCDVTKALHHDSNRKVMSAESIDLALLFYVCHETSLATRKGKHQFYKDLSTTLKNGCIVVAADVNGRSKEDLELVFAHMSHGRKVVRLALNKSHNAEVLAFQYVQSD